jgi:predicted amidohydrolase
MAGEHERYAAGRERITLELLGWRVCPLVCYDLRFPVFVRNRHGVEAPGRFDYDLLLFVANWPAPRRYAWQTLLRARAIENLAYVVSANTGGFQDADLAADSTDGMSKIVDYLGEVRIEAGFGESAIACAEIDLAALRRYRRRPGMGNLLARQRLELFAPVYGGAPVHPANTLLDAEGAVITPQRAQFAATQREVIERLARLGLV